MANKKNKLKGIFNWTFFSIVVVAIVLFNIISSFINFRVDATNDKRYSLAESTKNYLDTEEKLDNRLYIKIYLDGNLPADLMYFRNALEDKLKEFKEYAGKKIEYEFINPNIGTEGEQQELFENIYAKGKGIVPMDVLIQNEGQQSQLLIWPGAIIEYEGTTKNVIQFLPGTPLGKPVRLETLGQTIQNSLNNLEYILMTSIRRTVEKTRPSLGFLQGHGELSYGETQRARALVSPYFSITDVTINDSLAALDDIEGLIIARPTQKFSDKDLYIIDQFVLRGGKLMCFMDALSIDEDTLMKTGVTHSTRNYTGLEKMLFDYGLKLNDNFVLDVRCAPKVVPLAKETIIPWYYHVLASPTSHPIARNLEPVSLEYVNEIQFVGSDKLALTPILTSSTNSTRSGMAPMISLGMPMNYGKDPKLVVDPENEINKICLAGLAEGFFESHFKNRIVDDFAKNPLSKYKEKSTKEGKVLLVGNGTFIQNDFDTMVGPKGIMYRPKEYNDLRFDPKILEMGIEIFYGNQEFFQNAVDYMMGENSVLDIRSRQIDIHQIDKEKVKISGFNYKIVNLILPCFIVVILAALFFFIRKNKYTE